jgi:redox-sensing transcriptional repressor
LGSPTDSRGPLPPKGKEGRDGKGRRDPVSEATTHRISLLLRCLRILEAEGVGTISSHALDERFGLNSAQIRKDLAQFGEFGIRGVGYRVGELKARLEGLMGLDRPKTIAIVGAGNLGQALADSRNFNSEGFRVGFLFDVDGRKIGGRSRTGVPIRSFEEMSEALRGESAEIGVIAVPAEAVSDVARALVEAGVEAILNFAPVTLTSEKVIVKNVDLTLFLENLSFQLGR